MRVRDPQVPYPNEELDPRTLENDVGFVPTICPVVDCHGPWVWSEAAVKDQSWRFVEVHNVYDTQRGDMHVRNVKRKGRVAYYGVASGYFFDDGLLGLVGVFVDCFMITILQI